MIVAACFLLAAAGEAAVVHRSAAGPLLFGIGGAPTLVVLALRRTRPLLPLAVIAVAAAFGTAVQTALWPHAGDGGGVWLFALLFAAYSFGLYGRAHTISIGTVLPMAAALAIDVPTMRGWSLVNGITFLTVFVGLLPSVVGRTIRLRRERIARLAAQQDVIVREQGSREEAAVLDERVRASERLQPALLDGLAEIARSAEDGAAAAHIEDAARRVPREGEHPCGGGGIVVVLIEVHAAAGGEHPGVRGGDGAGAGFIAGDAADPGLRLAGGVGGDLVLALRHPDEFGRKRGRRGGVVGRKGDGVRGGEGEEVGHGGKK